jgi:hypothetical protein
MRAGAELAKNNRVAAADAKDARACADTLHQLFDGLGCRAHARPARRHRRHATQGLQAFRKGTRVPFNVAVEA